MKFGNYLLFIVILVSSFLGCNNDDDDPTEPNIVEEEDRGERQIKDNDSLLGYFETHYYNSEELELHPNPTLSDIVITELVDGETVPAGHKLLSEEGVLRAEPTNYLDVDYTYYVLDVRTGGGEESPKFSDSVFLNYVGFLQNASVFDGTATPVTFDLVNLVPGWRRVLPEFNVATGYTVNQDGTVTFDDPGIGVMFLPSGLGYFSSGQVGIPAYSNLIFKFELFRTEENDHDRDGIPSYMEDIDKNNELADDDTDENGFPDYLDIDDDGDGTLTIDELQPNEYIINVGDPDPILEENEFEISRSENDGKLTINTVKLVDSNGDNLWDYLDKNITTSYNE